ncbi:hypothetical protein [Nostoc sp. C117]|uniref:hypothetical protein n=1 Tax=Nostoc sp. C117 TaxID=3349875 RepID=UPI00370D8637
MDDQKVDTNYVIRVADNGLQLMPQIKQIHDLERLKTILWHIVTANNLEELQ